MRWKRGYRSKNVEDRRGQRPLARGGLKMGLGGIVVLLVLSLVFKQDFFSLVGGNTGVGARPAPAPSSGPVASTPEEDERVQFVSFVLDDAQVTWAELFPSLGGQYQEATLVLFRDAVQSACGFAQAASGPFYCPGDHKVYIDLSFYDELRTRFGAPGDFAQAYVIAHEIGHHVQRLLGVEEQVRQLQRSNPQSANELSVKMELQADCFAGVWGHTTAQRGILEQGDLEEGLDAAAAIGDDRIQRQTTGRVNPDGFTHGTSAQRQAWFRQGFENGDPRQCDAFAER